MRELRDGLRVAKLIDNSQVTKVGRRVGVRLQRALGRAVARGRVWNVVVLSRVAQELEVRRQLGGLDVDVMAQSVLVDVRVG